VLVFSLKHFPRNRAIESRTLLGITLPDLKKSLNIALK